VRIPKFYHAFEHRDFGYIVMEYIDGLACDKSDALQVATTVECLIRVTGPTTVPGPVGGGPITHRFFVRMEIFRYIQHGPSVGKTREWSKDVLLFSYALLTGDDRFSQRWGCHNGSASMMKSAMAFVFAPAT
jgi:hypothetical protein